MINNNKWVNSLPKQNKYFNDIKNPLDHDIWLKTISKKEAYTTRTKYYLTTILFICGLLFVSVVKNETRNLQKTINTLETSINYINFNLDQAILDYEVITSPENISLLAEEHLNTKLKAYKSFQIINSNFNHNSIKNSNNASNKKSKSFPASIKKQLAKNVEINKMKVREIQQFYANPKLIPTKIRKKLSLSVEEKKSKIESIINDPHDIFTAQKISKWTAMQVVKLFFGMPVIPGR